MHVYITYASSRMAAWAACCTDPCSTTGPTYLPLRISRSAGAAMTRSCTVDWSVSGAD